MPDGPMSGSGHLSGGSAGERSRRPYPHAYAGRGLSSNALKLIACAAMFGDHAVRAWNAPMITKIIFSQIIGRIAFPMFCFFIAEGFIRSKNRAMYIARMLIFAAAAEMPFDLVLFRARFYPGHQNTMFALALGLVMFLVLEKIESFGNLRAEPAWLLKGAAAAGFAYFGQLLHVDYGAKGIVCMAVIYLLREQPPVVSSTFGAFCTNIPKFNNAGAILGAIPLSFYNGELGRKRLKYFFYIFYPAHLCLIQLLVPFMRR